MIIKKEYYTQKDGRIIIKVYCKNGYFYCDKEDEDIVDEYTWEIIAAGSKTNLVVPRTSIKIENKYVTKTFAQLISKKYHNEYNPKDKIMDHINGVEIDNVKSNLRLASIRANGYNQFKQGYTINKLNGMNGCKHTNFFGCIKYDQKMRRPKPYGNAVQREDIVCKAQYALEHDWLREQTEEANCIFDIALFRRTALDILDLERTGQISTQNAIDSFLQQDYICKNPWYIFRYNLTDYYIKHNIHIPEENKDWYIGFDGFMYFSKDNTLCRPFAWGCVNRIN